MPSNLYVDRAGEGDPTTELGEGITHGSSQTEFIFSGPALLMTLCKSEEGNLLRAMSKGHSVV